MKKLVTISCMIGFCMAVSACSGEKLIMVKRYKKPDKYNIRITAYNININDPEKDRRCYYKIFIDKEEAGRTSTGLESQMVSFEAYIPYNRHLLTVEKWVLDQKAAKYVKLNNIEQPRPNFLYFDVPQNRITVISLMSDNSSGRSSFDMGFEYE